jgi:hypothetical protein
MRSAAPDTAIVAPRDIAAADPEQAAGALAHILATGDLAKLSDEQRVAYYLDLCRSLSLSPRSRPFDWLLLDGRLILYPNKSCAEQLRRAHRISVRITRREPVGDLFVVEAEGTTPSGRTDTASKYVPLTAWNRQRGAYERLRGKELADAYAKCETGAKRRLTFSMVGLAALPDPDELRAGRAVVVDGTGAVLEHPTEEQRYLAATPAAARAIGEPTFETTASPDAAPLAATPTQAVRPDELARPARPRTERPSFRPSADDVEHRLRTWFAAVKQTSLDDDDARHRFVEQWTASYVPGLRTDSLRAFFEHATERQAGDLLAHVRAIVDDEKRAGASGQADPDGDGESPSTPPRLRSGSGQAGEVF